MASIFSTWCRSKPSIPRGVTVFTLSLLVVVVVVEGWQVWTYLYGILMNFMDMKSLNGDYYNTANMKTVLVNQVKCHPFKKKVATQKIRINQPGFAAMTWNIQSLYGNRRLFHPLICWMHSRLAQNLDFFVFCFFVLEGRSAMLMGFCWGIQNDSINLTATMVASICFVPEWETKHLLHQNPRQIANLNNITRAEKNNHVFKKHNVFRSSLTGIPHEWSTHTALIYVYMYKNYISTCFWWCAYHEPFLKLFASFHLALGATRCSTAKESKECHLITCITLRTMGQN